MEELPSPAPWKVGGEPFQRGMSSLLSACLPTSRHSLLLENPKRLQRGSDGDVGFHFPISCVFAPPPAPGSHQAFFKSILPKNPTELLGIVSLGNGRGGGGVVREQVQSGLLHQACCSQAAGNEVPLLSLMRETVRPSHAAERGVWAQPG